MKALLLVGGYATRLRPLSLDRPKCLFPVDNKPIIDYLIENLAKANCTEVILAVNNHAEKIKNYLGEEKHGIKLHYSQEDQPLGTGGPIKLATNYLQDEPFLVLNGDILSWIDYAELMQHHKENHATATLTLKQVSDPTRYGVVRFGENDSIQEFVEKPTREQAPSNWINAGCYALNPEILNTIPEGKVSIERQVFPKLAAQNKLKGYKYHGDWIDIGVPSDYLRADKLIRKTQASINPTCIIHPNATITDSIIWGNTTIGPHTIITGTIIGRNTMIGHHISIKNSVIADNTIIDHNLIITDTTIYPNLHIETNIKNREIKT